MKITHSQKRALAVLLQRHEAYPEHANFATIFLGVSTAAMLRKLAKVGLVTVKVGLVTVTPGGLGYRQFFAITDAGRAILEEKAQ